MRTRFRRLHWFDAAFVAVVLTNCAQAQSSPSADGKRQIGQMVLDGVPEWSEAAKSRMLQYLEVRRAGLRDLSDDGRSMVIGTRFGNTAQLHLVSMPMGMRKQITFFEEPVGGGSFVPGSNGKRILYSKDQGGNERAQFYQLDLETGQSVVITDGKSRNTSAVFSKTGRWLAYSSTRRNEKDFDVYLIDYARALGSTSSPDPAQVQAASKLIWQVEGQYTPADFSPDETKLIVEHYLSERETAYYVHDITNGDNTRLTPEEPAAFYGSAVWSADGKAVYITSDRAGEFRTLYRLDMEYGKWEALTADIPWDIDSVAVEPTGKGIAFVANEDGFSRLYFADPWGKGRKQVTSVPPGVIGGMGFAQNGGVLGLTVQSSQSPGDVYTTSFPDGQITRWTESEIGGLNPARFVEPSIIRYPTFDLVDGKPRLIPALYYKPAGSNKFPVVIFTHGGPEGQTQPTFSSTFQYWVNELGIAVIAPNVRGSTGYGRSFHQLDNEVKREDSVKDIGALLDWIAQQPELDASRVGIYGGSYGGYMVLGSLVNYPDRIKAGIDVVGIASFITFLETTPEYRRDLRRQEYGDERVPEVRAVLEKISPLANAEKIKSALFVAHGKNDPRVPYTEAEQIVARVRAMGRPVWYALALNEGHGFAKRENSDLAQIMYALFWEQELLR